MKKLHPEMHGTPQDWPNVTFDATFEGLALVGFLDLLGFSNKVNETWGTDQSILPVILGLKERVNEPPMTTFKFNNEKNYYHSDAFSISDSIVLRYPLKYGGTGPELYRAFLAMSGQIYEATGYAADHGFAIRGGVEFGPIYWDGHEMIGPAFNTAYHLESKVAKSARVIVGPAILRSFGRVADMDTIQAATIIHQSSDGLATLNPNAKIVPQMRAIQAAAPVAVADKYEPFFSRVRSLERTYGSKHGRWNRLADAVEAALDPEPIVEQSPEPGGNVQADPAYPSKRSRRRRKGRV